MVLFGPYKWYRFHKHNEMLVAKLNRHSFSEYHADCSKLFPHCTLTTCEHALHHEPTQDTARNGAHTQAQRLFRIKHHRTLPKTSAHVRLRSLKVIYTREVQGEQKWLTKPHSTYLMSLHIAQVDMRCELSIFMATDEGRNVVGNKGYCHRPGTWPNFRSLADDAPIAPICLQTAVSAYSKVLMTVYSVCWE
jgi:hypothetical protein